MFSSEFIFRMLGMIAFALAGARLGVDAAEWFALPSQAVSFIFALVGVLFGLIITPWLTVRPTRFISKTINEISIEILFMALVGLVVGLLTGLLAAYPLALLDGVPTVLSRAGNEGQQTRGARSRS